MDSTTRACSIYSEALLLHAIMVDASPAEHAQPTEQGRLLRCRRPAPGSALRVRRSCTPMYASAHHVTILSVSSTMRGAEIHEQVNFSTVRAILLPHDLIVLDANCTKPP